MWPRPIPTWFWAWAKWRLTPGGVRPPSAPAHVPKWAWARLALLIRLRKKFTKTYSGICLKNGSWLRNPRGGVEGVKEAVDFGVDWFGLNLNKGDWLLPASWDTVRARSYAALSFCVPWKRCYTYNDARAVLDEAYANNDRACALNLEYDPVGYMPDPEAVENIIKTHPYQGEVVIFVVAWLYNSVNWKALSGHAFVLEMFDTPESKKPIDCVAHAHSMGIRDVFFAFDGRLPPPDPLLEPWSVYTGDDAASRWYPRG